MKAMDFESIQIVAGGEEIALPTDGIGGGFLTDGGFWSDVGSGLADAANGAATAFSNCASGAKDVSAVATVASFVTGPEVGVGVLVAGCGYGILKGAYNTYKTRH